METGKGSRLSLSRKRKKGSEDGLSGSFVHTPNKSELACQIKEENTETVSITSSYEKNPKAAIILERREENSRDTKKSIAAWLTKSHKPRTVSCPVCDKLVLLSTINRHLDSNCESDTSRKSQEDSNQNSRSSKVNETQKGDKDNSLGLPSKENEMELKECKVNGRLTQTNESLFPSKNVINVGNGFNVDFPCAKVRTRGEHSKKSVKRLKNDGHSSFEEIFEEDFQGSLTDTTKGNCSVAELSSKGKTAEFVIADEESEMEETNMQTNPGLHKVQDLSKDATNSDKSKDDNEEHNEKKLEAQVGELQNNYEPYYLANFKLVLSNVMSNEDDRQLFNEQDNEVIDQFNAMSSEEQKLYIRLFQRKRGWFRCAKLDYPKICKDLKPVTDLLIEKGFLQDENQLINLQEALNLIAAPELKLLVKSLHISPGKKGGTKEELIETIFNLAENQKTIFGSFRSVVLKRTRQVLGSCVRVAPFPREVFSRVLLLFTMNVIPDDEDTTSNGQAQQL